VTIKIKNCGGGGTVELFIDSVRYKIATSYEEKTHTFTIVKDNTLLELKDVGYDSVVSVMELEYNQPWTNYEN